MADEYKAKVFIQFDDESKPKLLAAGNAHVTEEASFERKEDGKIVRTGAYRAQVRIWSGCPSYDAFHSMRPSNLLKTKTIEALSPGVKDLVLWLSEQGFQTSDSGDGTHYAHGMGCAVPYAMVAICSSPENMVSESLWLRHVLEKKGLVFGQGHVQNDEQGEEIPWPQIQATYDPYDGTAVIVLVNVLSRDIGL